jgi:hypothetical protein
MARKSINELIAEANAAFPDNVTGLITPADLRDFCLNFLNAISPAYGYLTAAGPLSQTFGLTAALVVFSSAFDSDPAQTTSNAAAGSVARSERGTSTINFTVDVSCANNVGVTFTLNKNGTPTQWKITATGRGASNPVSVALTAIDYADPAATYTVTAVAENAGTACTLEQMALIVGIDPVRSYT